MQEIKEQPTTESEATDGLMADALRAEAWAGEPFIREGEDPAKVLAPATSRRRALDDALAEIEGGRRTPSSGWKVEYGLMLGLERVLAEEKPHLASGTELRRHQIGGDRLECRHADRVLCGHRGDHRRAEHPMRGEGLEIRLDPGAAAGVTARNCQC